MKLRPIHLLLLLLLLLLAGELTYTKLIRSAERSAYIMGSPIRVKVLGANAPYLVRRGLWQIRKLDRLLSSFKPQSDVSLVNKLAGQAPVEVAPETFDCVKQAQEIAVLTNGAFDITLGRPWALVLDQTERKIFLKDKAAKIDLGGIGKGYAAELTRRLLLKKGAKSGMIDMRSSIAVFGPKVWEIGIQHPRQAGQLLGKVKLTDGQSLATSGDYERGEHIIDPLTKQPAGLCQAVTVIGRNAAQTDALATAVFVLGPEQGKQLIEDLPGFEALIVDRQGKLIRTKGFSLEKI